MIGYWELKKDVELDIHPQKYKVVDKRGKKITLETLSGSHKGDYNELSVDKLLYLMS